jgi:hypothetical protein
MATLMTFHISMFLLQSCESLYYAFIFSSAAIDEACNILLQPLRPLDITGGNTLKSLFHSSSRSTPEVLDSSRQLGISSIGIKELNLKAKERKPAWPSVGVVQQSM